MAKLTAEEIMALVNAGESQTVEFKLEGENQPDLSELLVALANSDGGVILIGITDERRVQGVTPIKVNDVMQKVINAAHGCRPPVHASLNVYMVEVEGKAVIVCQLPPLRDQLYSYSGKHLRREGSHNVAVFGDELKELVLNRMSQDFDAHPMAVGLDALDADLVRRFLLQRATLAELRTGVQLPSGQYPDELALKQLDDLRAINLSGDQPRPTMAGLLMLGAEPQAMVPHAVTRLAAFADEGVTFLDRAEAGGTIEAQLNAALAFVTRNTRLGAVIRGAYREERPDYPITAVREAVVNALLHRSYSERVPVSLYIFPDRIEIISPGGLPPGLTADSLEGRHKLRNHIIGAMAYFAAIAEKWGTGVWRMRSIMREAGLPEPSFHAEPNWVRVVFRRSAAVAAPTVQPSVDSGDDEKPPLPATTWLKLNERQRTLLAAWLKHGGGSINRDEYQARFNLGRTVAYEDLGGMVALGVAEQRGKARAIRYHLPDRLLRADDSPDDKADDSG